MDREKYNRRDFFLLGGAAVAAELLGRAQPVCASTAWVDHRAHGPFRFQSMFPLQSYQPVFRELSELELELQRTLAIPPAQKHVDVYLMNDQESHQQLIRRLYPRVPYRRALYVKRAGRASVYTYRHPELAIDLRHECTHALLHANLPMVPLWLDEGLAEYFEMPRSERSFGHPHLPKLKWNLRFGLVRNLESLEACQELSEMGGVEYRFAWAWVHFMLHGPLLAHRTLVHYLSDIRLGNPPGHLSNRLNSQMSNLEQQLAKHFRNWRR